MERRRRQRRGGGEEKANNSMEKLTFIQPVDIEKIHINAHMGMYIYWLNKMLSLLQASEITTTFFCGGARGLICSFVLQISPYKFSSTKECYREFRGLLLPGFHTVLAATRCKCHVLGCVADSFLNNFVFPYTSGVWDYISMLRILD